MTENKMVGWHHQLNGHEFEQTQGDSKGQGSLVCCSPWGHKELDTTQQMNDNNNNQKLRRGKEGFYSETQREQSFADTLNLDFQPPKL